MRSNCRVKRIRRIIASLPLFSLFSLYLRQARGSHASLLPPFSPSHFLFPPLFHAAFSDVLSASSEVLFASSEVISLSKSTISPLSTISRLVSMSYYRPPLWIYKLFEVFRFNYFKIRFVNFRKPHLKKRHSRSWLPQLSVAISHATVQPRHVVRPKQRIWCPSALPPYLWHILVFPDIFPATCIGVYPTRAANFKSASTPPPPELLFGLKFFFLATSRVVWT